MTAIKSDIQLEIWRFNVLVTWSSGDTWDSAAFQTGDIHTETDWIMICLFSWHCHNQINANSSWHLSDRVKDLHISTEAHPDGQVAQYYWYGVYKAKDNCNSFIYKTSKWGIAVCVCLCVCTNHRSETLQWQFISQQTCRAVFLIVRWWTVTFGISGHSLLCGQNPTDSNTQTWL